MGFYEPDFQLKSFTPQIVLVPLLAFDNQGNRLGYGGGFYDRFYYNNKNIVYVGYGFSFQQVQKIPSNNYDLKLSYIVTDSYIKKVVWDWYEYIIFRRFSWWKQCFIFKEEFN